MNEHDREHLEVEDLLALRDGDAPSAAASAHLDGCARCRAELARLTALREGLRALPPVPPGPEQWARVVAAVEPPVEVVARRARVRLMVAGVAASAAMVASVALVMTQGARAPVDAYTGLELGGPQDAYASAGPEAGQGATPE